MNDIVLISVESDLVWIHNKFPDIDSDSLFFVQNGAWPLQGRRIKNAHVELMCYKDPNFEECILQIQSNMALTADAGHIYLF